jgi:cyclopropane fatty-acyl-phospholipid synthase-like methyltransferase
LDGVEAKLSSGARVADIGCGLGSSTVLLAQAYPNCTFAGSDYHAGSIELAAKRAADAGVSGRVNFEVASAAQFSGSDYDLVATFDCLHDMGDPLAAAKHVRQGDSEQGVDRRMTADVDPLS